MTQESSFKGGVYAGQHMLFYLTKFTEMKLSLRMLREPFMTQNVGLAFSSLNFLTEPLKDKIMQLRPSGLLTYWVDNYLKQNRANQESEPEVLTMEHLTIGFQVCCMPLSLAFIAFIIEWLRFIVNIKYKRLRVSSVMKSILTAYFKMSRH